MGRDSNKSLFQDRTQSLLSPLRHEIQTSENKEKEKRRKEEDREQKRRAVSCACAIREAKVYGSGRSVEYTIVYGIPLTSNTWQCFVS